MIVPTVEKIIFVVTKWNMVYEEMDKNEI